MIFFLIFLVFQQVVEIFAVVSILAIDKLCIIILNFFQLCLLIMVKFW